MKTPIGPKLRIAASHLQPPRGSIDPFIGISFKLGPPVDTTSVLTDGRAFKDIREYQALVADSPLLLKNMTEQLSTYAAGRPIAFSDREQVAAIIAKVNAQGGGLRTLIHELIQSPLFQSR